MPSASISLGRPGWCSRVSNSASCGALTDAGSALVRGFRGDRREAIDRALSTFTDAERADLARLLTKLADGWPQG